MLELGSGLLAGSFRETRRCRCYLPGQWGRRQIAGEVAVVDFGGTRRVAILPIHVAPDGMEMPEARRHGCCVRRGSYASLHLLRANVQLQSDREDRMQTCRSSRRVRGSGCYD